MSILDYLRQRLTPPNPSQHTPSPWIRNFERNLLAFDGMADLFDAREPEPLRERITPPEPRKSLLASFKFFQLVASPASQTQERPKLLATPERLIYYKRSASNFFISVSSFIDFTIRPRLGELFPGIFPQYDFDLLGLGAQDREITKEIKDPKSEMYLQMSVIKKISRGVRSAGREVRRSTRKTGRAVAKATKKTGKWIKENPGETVVIAVVATAVTLVIIATAGGAAAAAVGGAAAGGATAAATKKKEDEEEKSRPVAPPPPPRPVPPISTAPSGVPIEITRPFTVSPPEGLNIPPEYRQPPSIPNMPAPVPPVGSPNIPSYRDSVSPITSIPQSTNPGLSPHAGRIEPPRSTAPVISSPSGGHQVTPQAHLISSPEEKPLVKEVVDGVKHSLAKDSHEVLDTIGNLQIQTAKLENIAVDAINQVIPEEKALHKRDLNEVQERIAAGHQNIDDFFDTSLAEGYDPETKALMKELGVKKPTLLIAPVPGTNLAGKVTAPAGNTARTTSTALTALEGGAIQEGAVLGRQVVVIENAAAVEAKIPASAKVGKIEAVTTNERKLFKFTETTAKHMNDAERMVPIHTLENIVKSPMAVVKDPMGASNAMMHYSQIWKNGKMYNVEVLYDKSTDTILHFQYSRDAMGPLEKVTK